MRFSGFSFRLGKRTRLYFSNTRSAARKSTQSTQPTRQSSAGRVSAFTVWGYIAAVVAIYQAFFGTWRGLISSACFSALFFLIASKRKDAASARSDSSSERSDAAAPDPAETPQPVTVPAASEPKYKEVKLLLELDASSKQQKMLHDLKLKMLTKGVRGDLDLEETDGIITASANGKQLGRVSTSDAIWITRCLDYVGGTSSFEITGGGVDAYGNARPFMAILKLQIRSSAPAIPEPRDLNILPAVSIWGVRSDTACYVSSNGVAHSSYGNCHLGETWPVMFVYEAEAEGYEPCSKCFR